MEDDKNTTFKNTTFKNTTFPTEIYDYKNSTFTTKTNDYINSPEFQYYMRIEFVMHVSTCVIITIGLPLTLVTIYALYSLVRKDHVAPIYVINLLITDFLQLCSMLAAEARIDYSGIFSGPFYYWLLFSSVCFMVCVSLERYLVIAHPLWYRFRRNIKTSVVVCVVVWLTPPVFFCILFWIRSTTARIIISTLLLIPFPFFIFFLVGTLRALSTSVSVSSEEKRRIAGIQVLVLLIYTLLFLPSIIWFLLTEYNEDLENLSLMFVKLSPLADLSLYIFIRKETFAKCLAAACCKKENNDNPEPAVNVDDI